jgi:hypothetical protein
MKKRILTSVIITFSIIELFAQLPPDKEIKKIGQFQWRWTAADSLNIMENPFIYDSPIENSLTPVPNPPKSSNRHETGIIPDQPDNNQQYIIDGDNKR